MEERKKLVHIRIPDPVEDNLYKDSIPSIGGTFYNTYCLSCHQADGRGDGSHFPPLVGSAKVKSKELLIATILNGVSTQATDGNVTILMPPHNFLNDAHLAEVASYVRMNFGSNAEAVSAADVKKIRKALN
jgi:mono/diheme cytochrome c family protein